MIGDKKKFAITMLMLILLVSALILAQNHLDSYKRSIISLGAIYVTLAIGLNIVFGLTGQFSLGHAGFMAVGAYVATLVSLSPEEKAANFFIVPISPMLKNIQIPFFFAVILGGLVAAIFAILIGIPIFSLRDDYLGMATLGFSEIIRVMINNLQTITNGSLGIKDLPHKLNLYWTFGWAAFSVFIAIRLIKTSYGRVLKSIRDDDIAAEAVGIRLRYMKVFSFTISAFLAGVGGALLGFWATTIDPKMFTLNMTFQILMIVVAGGLGNITGSVVMAFLVAIAMETLRFIEGTIDLGFITITGVPGMRMLGFSVLLLIIIVRFSKGLFGTYELSSIMHQLVERIKNKTFKRRVL